MKYEIIKILRAYLKPNILRVLSIFVTVQHGQTVADGNGPSQDPFVPEYESAGHRRVLGSPCLPSSCLHGIKSIDCLSSPLDRGNHTFPCLFIIISILQCMRLLKGRKALQKVIKLMLLHIHTCHCVCKGIRYTCLQIRQARSHIRHYD